MIVLWPSAPLMTPSATPIERAGSGVLLFKLPPGDRHQTFDPIDDKADRGIAAQDNHSGLLARVMMRQMQECS